MILFKKTLCVLMESHIVMISHTRHLKSMILSTIHSATYGTMKIPKVTPILFQNIGIGIVPVILEKIVSANMSVETRLKIQADMLMTNMPTQPMRIKTSSTGSRTILTGNKTIKRTNRGCKINCVSPKKHLKYYYLMTMTYAKEIYI